jgi:hypothetical protein
MVVSEHCVTFTVQFNPHVSLLSTCLQHGSTASLWHKKNRCMLASHFALNSLEISSSGYQLKHGVLQSDQPVDVYTGVHMPGSMMRLLWDFYSTREDSC